VHLSIKQKQVLGVTTIVGLVVIAISLMQFATLSRVLLEESRARAELVANSVYHQAREVVTSRENAYQDIRASRTVQSALESAIYDPNVTYAAIVDRTGSVIASSDPSTVGTTIAPGRDLNLLTQEGRIEQVRGVYAEGATLEWRQPMALGDEPFGDISIGLSTILLRQELNRALVPALVATALAMVAALIVSTLLAQVMLRPINVVTSGLIRLGRGDLGATLDLRDEEFRDLGDVFDQVSAQLRTTGRGGRKQITDLSKRVASLGRLTAGVAHEVKNPLNAMTIHLELLKQKLAGPNPANALTHAEIISAEIKRLDEVVQGFLKFVRPEDVTFAPVPVARLWGTVIDAIGPEAQAAGVKVEQACTDAQLLVSGDEGLLRQALLNLAQNAVQAMTKGGRLTVSCVRGKDDRVELRIEDTGMGIPPEQLAKIFDLYFTTKPRGSGIGLSMVYRTIQLHHGDIEVASTVGQGTTFVIKLPEAQ
jgi:signal transduction histidine kinase